MEHTIKFFSTIFFPAYMLVAFVWPSIRTYKSTGINPFVFGKTDSATDYVGKLFKVNIAMVPFSIIFLWIGDTAYQRLMPITYLYNTSLKITGVVVCMTSFIWTVIAQLQMGNSWRIGIDEQNKTALVTHGLFNYSRNPIFLGMILTLSGVFMLIPNAITLLAFCLGYVLIQVQIRIEEEFLSRQYGIAYAQYKTNTRRLI